MVESQPNEQVQALLLCLGRECVGEFVQHVREGDLLGANLHAASFYLGEVEDFANERQQVTSGLVDDFGCTDLVIAKVLVFVGAEHLGEQQDAVQRSAQFMGDVGEKLCPYSDWLARVALLSLRGLWSLSRG